MLARIIANRYPLVILDEPTSALDPLTERKINRYVMQTLASPERTILFISHRLFTTQLADRILVFDKGTIVEEGNHCELMEKKGHYYEMYQLQQKLYGQEEIESAKRKPIVRNNFYLFGKAMSAEPGFVVLSALMRVVVSVRTSFLRVIFLAYIISCMEQKKRWYLF